MKVAIVGGSGHLGRHIMRGLQLAGDDVVILSRDPGRTVARVGPGQGIAGWSPDDPVRLSEIVRGFDAVVNLAGVPVGPHPWTRRRRREIVRSRLTATRTIVAALALLPPGERPAVLVSASGTDVYTGLDAVAATEATPPTGGFLSRVCRAWEGEAGQARSLDVRVAIVRIGFVLAPDSKALGLYALPFRLHLGGRIGSGRQWMSWIHVEDLVGLVRTCLHDQRAAGVVNVVAPAPSRQADVARAIGTALGRRSWLPVPAVALRLVMGEQAILPLGSRRIAPARAVELGYRFRWPDLVAAMVDVFAPGTRT